MKFSTIHFFRIGLIAVVVGIFSIQTQAQKAKLKIAQKHYDKFEFVIASQIYADILSSKKHSNDTVALRMIADCERRLNQFSKAEGHLIMLSNTPAVKTTDLRELANIQKILKKYPEALATYKRILTIDPSDRIASLYHSEEDFVEQMTKDSMDYLVRNSKINSAESDFAPGFFTSNKILYSSSRGLGVGSGRNYSWNDQPYLNIYSADILADSTLDNFKVLDDDVNSRYHEGTMSYDPRSNLMYMTRNNYVRGNVKKSKSGHLNLGIYTIKYSDEGYGNITPFPYNNSEYSLGHPTLSGSGQRIFFTSDMPGGMGGKDIYYCEKAGDSWGVPINAGSSVNTAGDEMFPYALTDSTLYFASDGWIGLGGLDVYVVHLGSQETRPSNMGYPINTAFDDFALIMYGNEMSGYMTSNRPGGKGDDDIYEFIVHPPDSVMVKGRVVEYDSLNPLTDAVVFVTAEDGSKIQVKTGSKGEYSIKIPYRSAINIGAEKRNYINSTTEILTNPKQTEYSAQEIVLKQEDIVAKGMIVYDADGSPAAGATIRVLDKDGKVLETTQAAADGSYKIDLPENQKVILEITQADYVKLTHKINTTEVKDRYYMQDFRLFKLEKGTVVRLDNIYYDYGKADIRPDAAVELNKLVEILKDNPTIKIELSSHTDARGSDSYNLSLSDKRANSAVKYIISQGIDGSRLVAKGYGETKLLNRCGNDVNCTEEEYQFNRRTEFKILDI